MCDSKESKFIKKQEVSGLLSDLGTYTPLVKFLQQVLFYLQLGFTYSAYGPFTKKKDRLRKFKETGN